MRVTVFASGSGGNCLLAESGGVCVLIDAGISMRRMERGLRQAGHTWQDISGVLITHEHSDHISGLKTLLRYHPVPLYAPHTVGNRLCGMLPECIPVLRTIPVGEPFSIGVLTVRAFHTSHDTDESVGYRLEDGAVFALATDTGCVTEEIRDGLWGADTVLLEANHDMERLMNGPYPVYLKRRILSERGHLCNADCAVLARALCENGTRRIVLGHLSKQNNTPELAFTSVSAALEGLEAQLAVAPPDGFLCIEVGAC